MTPCERCGTPQADRWPGDKGGELCQDCWEEACDEAWWAALDATIAQADDEQAAAAPAHERS